MKKIVRWTNFERNFDLYEFIIMKNSKKQLTFYHSDNHFLLPNQFDYPKSYPMGGYILRMESFELFIIIYHYQFLIFPPMDIGRKIGQERAKIRRNIITCQTNSFVFHIVDDFPIIFKTENLDIIHLINPRPPILPNLNFWDSPWGIFPSLDFLTTFLFSQYMR